MERGTKIYTLLLFCIFISFSEVGIAKENSLPINLFKRDQVQESRWNSFRSNVRVAVLEYNPDQYQQLKQIPAQSIAITLPTPEGDLRLNLIQNNILTDDFILNTDKDKNLAFTPGLHYKGHIEGQPNSMVAVSFFNDEVVAVVNAVDGKKFVVGNSTSFRRGSFVVYDASKLSGPGMDCGSESLPNYEERLQGLNKKVLEQRSAAGCVKIYFELGKSVHDSKGGSTGAANYITSVFNVVAALYANEGVTVAISEIFVWTTPEPYNASSATSALYNFGSTKKDNFNGNLAQLVRLKNSGGMSGVAWLDVLCYSYFASSQSGRFSYTEIQPTINSLPTYSWTAEVVTHELGHNLGSPHTQSCSWSGGAIDNCANTEGGCAKGPTPVNGGTIMSYCHLVPTIGINFNNGFGSKPGNLIRSRINAAACLTQCSATPCNAPGGLSATNITSSSVTLNWSSSSSATAYSVQYKLATSPTWTTATASTTALSYNLTGLTAGLSYNWQVNSICGSSNSSYADGTFATTGSACLTVAPGNLSSSNNSTSSTTVSWSAVTGALSYEVQFKRTTTTTWSVATLSTTAVSWTLNSLSSGIAYNWKVRANCTGGNGPFAEAQFTTSVAASCNAPSGLGVSNISTSGVTISWVAVSGAFNYSIEYKLASSSTWTAMNPLSATSFNFTGLAAGTSYDWRVKTNCSSGVSGFTQSSFTTTTAAQVCNAPSGLNTTSITVSGATLNWGAVAGALNYSLEYKLNTSSTWTAISGTVNTTTYNITGLSATTSYNWRVKNNCASGSSGFTSANFTTSTPPPVCIVPSSLTSNSITINSASLSWGAVAGAMNYSIEYKLSTSSTWTPIPGTMTSTIYSLVNLNPSTTYNWQVKTNCSTGSSGFSSATFTTTAPAVCNAPSGLAANSITTSSASLSWTAVSGALNYSIEYKLNSATTWIQVQGTQTGTSLILTGLSSNTVYNWKVKTNCASGSSGFSSGSFTTGAVVLTCSAPSALSFSSITSNAVTLSWTAVTGASSYSVEYKLGSASTWTAVPGTMSSNSYTLSGLLPNSSYNWQVKTNCSSSSSAMVQSSFTTTVENTTTCPGSVDNIENGIRTSAPSISVNTNILGKVHPSGDNDYFKFVLATGSSITATLSSLPADFDLRILNSAGTTLGLSQKSNLVNESVALTLNAGTYYARIYGWGTSNHATSCYNLKIQTGASATSSPEGITSTNELSTIIFPNPVKANLNFDIYGLDATAWITVMDLQSRKLIQMITKSSLNQLDVSNLAPGFYFLRIEDENKRRTTQKFMKSQ